MGLHEELRALIDRVRTRWTVLVALRAAARASAGAAAVLAAAALVDGAFRLSGFPLVVLAAAAGAAAVGIVAAAWWLKPARPADGQVARFIEERAAGLPGGGLHDSLVSAVDAAERITDAEPASFLPLMLRVAVDRLRAIDVALLVPAADIRRRALQAGGGGGVLILALVATAPSFERAAETARLRLCPGSVRIDVTPGDVRTPAGRPLTIRAAVNASAGTLKRLAPELTVTAGGEQRTVSMAPAGDGFEYQFESIDRTFAYRVRAGGAESSRYTVTALFPPRVERIDLHYVYPAFAGLAPRDEQDGGDVYAPAGTQVQFQVHADKPIVRAEIALRQAGAVPLQPSRTGPLAAGLVLAKDDSYRIRLTDVDGLTSEGEAEYFIRLMDDRPPDVRILTPAADRQITPLEEVSIEARADDDYGIGRFELVYAVAGRAEQVVRFERVTGTSVQRIGSRLLAAEDLGVKPGDVIAYYARARDIGRGKRPTDATSDIYFLEVKPFHETFVQAESQASGGGGDPQIESLIEAQKDIIASTWNVERRSAGGRSAGDVAAIAAAQAELMKRAEALAGTRSPGRLRQPVPQRRALDPRQADGVRAPVADAVAAMGRAFDELSSVRTRQALTHEMTALNRLLQAQAEVRRRQVSQQAGGAGGGGSSRAGQDLSALFDKELQRQQRTNYETRSAAETRPDQETSGSSALDRIRDLARRQEDLSRRQRELAQAQLNADERKRQLETLTREQEELRERVEALLRRDAAARQPPRRDGSPTQGTGTRAAAEGSGELREAADQMRAAAGSLGREDARGAARRAQQAADRLRRLERQLEGPSGKTAAGSDVGLEARQVAQEQRRIASEAGRLDQTAGAAAAEARDRLAAEKERLAGRVEALAQELGRGSAAGAGPDARARADAARQLQRDRVAERMRETAGLMRQGRGGDGAAVREQDLARTLDRVAGALGSNPDARSDSLDQARAIRERLQRAEAQLRAAEARGTGAAGGGERRGQTAGQGGGEGSSAGANAREVERLRDEYRRELERAQEALAQLNAASPRDGRGAAAPDDQQFSRAAPGTEAFKQDRSDWDSLRRNFDLALERYEAAVSDRLSRPATGERFTAGGSDRVPDAYRRRIAKYFESLAAAKK